MEHHTDSFINPESLDALSLGPWLGMNGTLRFGIETCGVLHSKFLNSHIYLDSLDLQKWSFPSKAGILFSLEHDAVFFAAQYAPHLQYIPCLPTGCQTSNLAIYNVTWLGKCWAC